MDFQYYLTNKLKERWKANYLGELFKTEVTFLQKGLYFDFEVENQNLPIDLLLANIATALSTSKLIGSASDSTLKSVKKRLDVSAGYVFADYLNFLTSKEYIAVSEGKDETGEAIEDPLKKLNSFNHKKYGIAVDVVDGTTLAAKGLNGAFSLSAAANGLISFPDMQAYAVGAPISILEKFDFYNRAEREVERLVENLCNYYDKSPNQLKIVTHSSDTGNHHRTLINNLISLGVQVIVPEPVIVEPPYVLGLSLRTENAPDCIIGVFGLPEIVINTLLLASIGEEYELQFRIASNAMLEFPNQDNLNDAFQFKQEEIEALNKLNLDYNLVYSKRTIASDLNNICSSSTALTYDPILDIQGCQSENSIIKLETIFSGYKNNTIKLSTYHKCFNSINYSACYPQKIDDISLILPANEEQVINMYETITSLIKHIVNNGIIYTKKEDLHITAYEFGIHYGGYNSENNLRLAKEELLSAEDNNTFDGINCKIMGMCRTEDSIFLSVETSNEFLNSLNEKYNDLKQEFFNIKRTPSHLHITIARFNRFISKKIMNNIDNEIKLWNENYRNTICFSSVPKLVHIIETPFNRKEI
jgi:fructose-1,6-bisphosphatase/sedoheptulose 1,7-bisphosphatase-like protein